MHHTFAAKALSLYKYIYAILKKEFPLLKQGVVFKMVLSQKQRLKLRLNLDFFRDLFRLLANQSQITGRRGLWGGKKNEVDFSLYYFIW